MQTAISTKKVEKHSNPREHFLDYANEKHGQQLVNDTKVLLKVLVLYLPLPVFWSLFDQQGSRWTFQATRMDGDIGFYTIKPDQMQIINPILILVFIPLYDMVFYPLLSKVGVRRPLQKITAGGFLAAIAFFLSALVEFQLEKENPILPGAQIAQLRIFNGIPCDYAVSSNIPNAHQFTLNALQAFEEKHMSVTNETEYSLKFMRMTESDKFSCPPSFDAKLNLTEKKASSLFVTGSEQHENDYFIDDPNRSETGDPLIRFLSSTQRQTIRSLIVRNAEHLNEVLINSDTTYRNLTKAVSGTYEIAIDKKTIGTITLKQGSVTTVIISEQTDGSFLFNEIRIVSPNSMNMLWLIPQYVVMTLGEVMFSITGLSFSYAQAPESMKSVLQACWLLTVAFGNALFMIVVEVKIFNSQAHEFLLFCVLMIVDMFIFMFLAYGYKSGNSETRSEERPLKYRESASNE